MRIGIDARTILNPEKEGAIGVGHYTYQLVRHILELDKQNEYVLFFDSRIREKDVRRFSKQKNVRIVFYPCSLYRKYFFGMYDETFGLATLQKEKLDLFHSASPENHIPMGYQGKSIVTFNELYFCKTPECLSSITKGVFGVSEKFAAHKANKIIAVSNALKNDLVKSLKIDKEKIEVIYNGVDKRFFETPHIKKERVLGKLGVRKKYILFLGTIEPEKNIERLLKAFALLKKSILKKEKAKSGKKKFDYQLVLAGKKEESFLDYVRIAKKNDIIKDVVFSGYVIGDEISTLLRNAEMLVAPSLYEGFGATVLEAFACDTPVIASNISSLNEIAGGAARLANPLNADEISDAMLEVLMNDEIKREMIEKGKKRAQEFDWKETAEKTIKLYEEVHKEAR